jgi:hypothetical protein
VAPVEGTERRARFRTVAKPNFNKISDVQSARGNLDGAHQAFQDGLDIREKLAAQDPGNAGWQRDLIVSHWKLADLTERRSVAGEATDHWRAALAIAWELQQSGRLAPVDCHFPDTVEARLAAASERTAP